MKSKADERKALLEEFLQLKEKFQQLSQENDLLKETNFHLSKRLEEHESTVDNLFFYIEDLKKK